MSESKAISCDKSFQGGYNKKAHGLGLSEKWNYLLQQNVIEINI